ncbi:MAG: hypothetical protein M1420_01425 [Actinobacteria bacterium]|jgi:hypothetical protein|nr:hypothetical protein [Actinomycetota bacterium]
MRSGEVWEVSLNSRSLIGLLASDETRSWEIWVKWHVTDVRAGRVAGNGPAVTARYARGMTEVAHD